MAMWHCPHCGTPQMETARCWVCRRSSTTCSTCRHFRPALAADLGYCALDRQRRPLTGRELRGCWEEQPAGMAPAAGPSPLAGLEPHRLRSAGARGTVTGVTSAPTQARGFVPIELLGHVGSADGAIGAAVDDSARPASGRTRPAPQPVAPTPLPIVLAEPDEDWTDRTSLFGDGDR